MEIQKNKSYSKVEFLLQLDDIIQYIIEGKIKRGKCFGIHLFCTSYHRNVEIIQPADKNGIWQALLETRHPKTNTWVKKEKSSTMFPKIWDEKMLKIKLIEAFENKKKKTSYKYIGFTHCKVPIVFIFQKGIISSVYPLIEK